MVISLPWLRLHPSDGTGRGNVTALAQARSCWLHHSAVLPALASAVSRQCGSASMALATVGWGGNTPVSPVIWKILRMRAGWPPARATRRAHGIA